MNNCTGSRVLHRSDTEINISPIDPIEEADKGFTGHHFYFFSEKLVSSILTESASLTLECHPHTA